MKALKVLGRWRPMAGVVVMSVLAYGLALQGAPTKQKSSGVLSKGVAGNQAAQGASTDMTVIGGPGIPRAMNGKLPVLPPVVVDYRNDDMTRAREAGEVLLEAGSVALMGCSNDEECNDCNPCTEDLCKWLCLGGGNNGLPCRTAIDCPGGVCPTYTLGTCDNRTYNLDTEAAADCDDDVFCNGLEVCSGAPAVCAAPPDPQCPDACDESSDECITACTNAGQCDDGQFCTTDACTGSTCVHTLQDCGVGGVCSQGATSYVCSAGRCCDYTAGTCTTTTVADCAPPKQWLGVNDCSATPPRTCPKYGSGIIDGSTLNWQFPFGSEPGVVGLGPAGLICDPLIQIGDDYTLVVASDYLEIQVLRFAGGVMPGPSARFSIELRDASGNLIEDVWYYPLGNAEGGAAIRTVIFDPPLIIPKSGIISMSVQPYFSPGGRIFWLSTKFPPNRAAVGVDRGTNDDAKLYINGTVTGDFLGRCNGGSRDGLYCTISGTPAVSCPSGTCDNVDDILAFEIIGTPYTTVPLGACCSTSLGTCQGTLPWACNGKFKGVGTFCALCINAAPPHNIGDPCNSDADCGVGVPVGSCSGQFCNISFTACDETHPCGPTQGECLNVATVCATRACCDTDGTCSEVSGIGEPCLSGTPLEYASDCQPNCCEQPLPRSGYDNCDLAGQNATVISLVGVWPNVTQVTIEGNNSAATFDDWNTNPKWCDFDQYSPYGTYKDPGWWEAFSIDDCAYIRVELCCTDPVMYPAWAGITTGCPCADVIQQTGVATPIGLGETTAGHARGIPFCEEDNTWGTYGPLRAGTYYYPIYSAPDGTFGVVPGALPPGGGDYRLNIYAARCPASQCCYLECNGLPAGTICENDGQCPGGQSCLPKCEILNVIDCQDKKGAWKPDVGDCATGVCDTGSCCPAPGQCEDTYETQDMTLPLCQLRNGTYMGGLKCVDEPCPICPFGDTANCQPSDGGFVTQSDLDSGDNGYRHYDDFIAHRTSISEVCVDGTWIDDASTQTRIDCACQGDIHPPEGPCVSRLVDKFQVSIYQDAGGLPGAQVGLTSPVTTWARAIETEYGNFDVWTVNLQLDTPITGLVLGQRYWISVVNDTDEPVSEDCYWAWAANGRYTGNNWGVTDSDLVIVQSDGIGYDMAFCLDQVLDTPLEPQGRCCQCEPLGQCTASNLYECEGMPYEDPQIGGSWDWGGTCTPNTCPNAAPLGDVCSQGPLVAHDGENTFSNLCATMDGPHPSLSCGGDTRRLEIRRDVWFAYVATMTGPMTFSFCANVGWDGMLAIYTNGTGTCACPTTEATRVACTDGGCDPADYAPEITHSVTQGQCYLLRIGGFAVDTDPPSVGPQVAGTFTILPAACTYPQPAPAVGDVTIPKRVRHLAFSAPGGEARLNAVRVKLTASTQFPGSVGKTWYVGEPRQVSELSGSTTLPPFFWLAQLQDTPFYKDWSKIGTPPTAAMIAVYGRGIAPGCTYEIALAPQGCEALDSAYSTALVVEASKWGDTVGAGGNPTPPDGTVNFNDISSLVDKFKNSAGAPSKSRADVASGTACMVDQIIDFVDVPAIVDAFKGKPYNAACAP